MAIAVDTANLGTAFSSPTVASISITTGAAVPSGGFIVLGVEWFGESLVNAVASGSGGGLTWAVDKNSTVGESGGKRFGFLSAQAPSGVPISTSLTCNFAGGFGGSEIMIGGTSLTGVKTSSPLDGSPPDLNNAAAATNWTSPSMTIQNGSILLSIAASDNATSNTPTGSSLEAWERVQAGDLFTTVMEYRIEATGGSFTNTGTFNTAGTVNAASCAYLAAPAGGAQNQLAWIKA